MLIFERGHPGFVQSALKSVKRLAAVSLSVRREDECVPADRCFSNAALAGMHFLKRRYFSSISLRVCTKLCPVLLVAESR